MIIVINRKASSVKEKAFALQFSQRHKTPLKAPAFDENREVLGPLEV